MDPHGVEGGPSLKGLSVLQTTSNAWVSMEIGTAWVQQRTLLKISADLPAVDRVAVAQHNECPFLMLFAHLFKYSFVGCPQQV